MPAGKVLYEFSNSKYRETGKNWGRFEFLHDFTQVTNNVGKRGGRQILASSVTVGVMTLCTIVHVLLCAELKMTKY